jgi:hypothetical protein
MLRRRKFDAFVTTKLAAGKYASRNVVRGYTHVLVGKCRIDGRRWNYMQEVGRVIRGPLWLL